MKPDLILGVGGLLGHDANAALLTGGRIVASSQEERFSRLKHDGSFPHLAAANCLELAGRSPAEVTDVVFAEKPLQSLFFDLSGRPGGAFSRAIARAVPPLWGGLYEQQARARFPRARFHHAWHHLSHVAGAFSTSPFDRAAFLCVDGKGEDYSASAGIVDQGEIRLLWEQPYENGLGLLYTLVTYYLGFRSFGSEYKVMGLAPYGRPVFAEALGRLFETDAAGGLRLKAPVRFDWPTMMAALPLVAEATGVPVREPADPLTEAHVDIAASLQQVFEEQIFRMARFIREKTGEERLLFCGGCAQNCVAAGKLRAAGIFRTLFNSPVGGDMGSGLGAALLLERERRGGAAARPPHRGFYLGPEPGPSPAAAQPHRVAYEGDLHEFVAAQLAAGKVVGWVRGGMELGARALGARSILADPRQPNMQSLLNLKVKFRESFRPFAPAILAEHVGEWFDSSEESDFMNYTAYLRPELRAALPASFATLRERLDFPRCQIPSVVHVDFSARLQTVRREVHSDFHRLISAFHARTGVPIVINTSFNVSGQPIVRTAAEGWDCFVNTDIDLLVLNDEVFHNPFEKTREQKLAWLKQFAKSA
ncbi:MAG TPA: carbamoyltransferase C-terminal domain-containing protein [Opitutaceae bacterium]|jgi:carbamoyltransferase|nr:carbamoyltransferase C-terminal domain-containing protein [Opitutaceae bacterium]